ncbi:MAG: glycosyltransferase [Oscillospiraceae bacterium]|jgi:glycosyltransferase involved in cell wall biosynthesis|nr:glycosyltransferase [Oscillospiraceae bacterium]
MSDQINVLYLLNHAGGGGSERYIESLIAGLGERIRPFFAFSEPGKLSAKLRDAGIPCFRLVMKSPFDFGAARRLASICKEHKIDVVHTHFLRENAIAVWAKPLCGARVINTVHMQTPKTGLALRLNRFIGRFCVNIAVSGAVLSNLKRECAGKTRLIYNGVEMPVTRQSSDVLQPERCVVLSVGRFSPEKGMNVLVKAAARLPELSFTLAGDGETLAECKTLATENVTFVGYVDDTEPLYRSADIYVCPSFEEALGLSVLEAMSYGLPAVVTDVGGLPEVADESCGIIVPPNDEFSLAAAIRRLAESAELRKTFGTNAREKIKNKFRLQVMAEQMFELYTEVLQ